MKRVFLSISLVASIFLLKSVAVASELLLLYQERPPYYVVDDSGNHTGLVSSPVFQALKKANIQATWSSVPPNRQIEAVKQNKVAVCSLGWFKKPEREEFAKFSESIYQDRPQIILMQTNVHRKLKHKTITSLLQDKSFRPGVKLGYSYGSYIDSLLEKYKSNAVRTTQDLKGMIRMLRGNRFDYFISTPEEFQTIIEIQQPTHDDLVVVEFEDIPAGNNRHLMCSKKVDDLLLKTFNHALKKEQTTER